MDADPTRRKSARDGGFLFENACATTQRGARNPMRVTCTAEAALHGARCEQGGRGPADRMRPEDGRGDDGERYDHRRDHALGNNDRLDRDQGRPSVVFHHARRTGIRRTVEAACVEMAPGRQRDEGEGDEENAARAPQTIWPKTAQGGLRPRTHSGDGTGGAPAKRPTDPPAKLHGCSATGSCRGCQPAAVQRPATGSYVHVGDSPCCNDAPLITGIEHASSTQPPERTRRRARDGVRRRPADPGDPASARTRLPYRHVGWLCPVRRAARAGGRCRPRRPRWRSTAGARCGSVSPVCDARAWAYQHCARRDHGSRARRYARNTAAGSGCVVRSHCPLRRSPSGAARPHCVRPSARASQVDPVRAGSVRERAGVLSATHAAQLSRVLLCGYHLASPCRATAHETLRTPRR